MDLPSTTCPRRREQWTPLVCRILTFRLNVVVWAKARGTPRNKHGDDIRRLLKIELNPMLRRSAEPACPERPNVAINHLTCTSFLAASPGAYGPQVPLGGRGNIFNTMDCGIAPRRRHDADAVAGPPAH